MSPIRTIPYKQRGAFTKKLKNPSSQYHYIYYSLIHCISYKKGYIHLIRRKKSKKRTVAYWQSSFL